MGYELSGFDGKVAVVTGAGRMRSIGRSIATELARAGCDLVLTGTGRSPDRYPEEEQAAGWRDVESVADDARAMGRRAHTVRCDVSSSEDVARLAAEVHDVFGRADILVNTAAAAHGPDRVPLVDIDPDYWQYVHNVNTYGPFLMCRAFGRMMLDAEQGGAIVNISSIASKYFPANSSGYASSKAGLNALTASMAQEVGPAGVRVNAICVGPVDTSRVEKVTQADGFDQVIRSTVPMQRIGTGEDIAHAVVFLCSDQGSWVTGQSWNVDGGRVVAR
jgi:3-oxoacyl-[acyl-carrier protein] reductase/meso-butanediol dehydrogenase/(S,S)-butanediol dehydrogenase/diacetyl reductase